MLGEMALLLFHTQLSEVVKWWQFSHSARKSNINVSNNCQGNMLSARRRTISMGLRTWSSSVSQSVSHWKLCVGLHIIRRKISDVPFDVQRSEILTLLFCLSIFKPFPIVFVLSLLFEISPWWRYTHTQREWEKERVRSWWLTAVVAVLN